jgi:NTP pyrophosphatase (non-canonical NTP hydrolase)
MSMTFDKFSSKNLERAKRWHDGDIKNWSLSDWLMAMAGEAGEACNAGKKVRRIEEHIPNLNEAPSRQLSDMGQALDKVLEELADTVIYCDLVAHRLGANLEDAIKEKFNRTSVLYGFPEQL